MTRRAITLAGGVRERRRRPKSRGVDLLPIARQKAADGDARKIAMNASLTSDVLAI